MSADCFLLTYTNIVSYRTSSSSIYNRLLVVFNLPVDSRDFF